MLKKFLLALSVCALSSCAMAADLLQRPMPLKAPSSPPVNWTGPYVGLHAGYGWGNERDNQSGLFPGGGGGGGGGQGGGVCPPVLFPYGCTGGGLPGGGCDDPGNPGCGGGDKFALRGFVGGVHIGHNFYQANRVVIGIEGDVDYTNLSGRWTGSYVNHPVTTLGLRSDWQASARLRAGYMIGRFLPYITGGVAVAHARLTTDGVGVDNTHLGWTVGLGGDYAFDAHWSGRVEARYSDFQNKTYQTIYGPVKSRWDQTTLTAGLSYRF